MSEIFVKKSLRVKVNLVRKLSIVSSQSEGGRENSSFSDVNNAGETLLDCTRFLVNIRLDFKWFFKIAFEKVKGLAFETN